MNRLDQRVASTAVAALAAVLLSACGSSVSIEADSGGSDPPDETTPDERDCLWVLDSNAVNALLPDTHANYWVAVLPIPPGGSVEFDGAFAHARYLSFNLYNEFLQPIDALSDFQVQPDAGSTNPYLLDADRSAAQRTYRVRLVAQAAPQDPAPRAVNTLYSAQTLGPVQVPANLAVVVYRTYVPDAGTGATGGAGLPHIVFNMANGTAVTGPAACAEPSVLSAVLPDLGDLPDPVADLPINTAAFENLLWLTFYDVQSAEFSRVFNTPLGPAVYELVGSPTSGNGGFLSNRDNRYIYATVSQRLGDIAVIHGMFPRAPTTSDGRSPMGGDDMRYWSLCSNDANTTAVYACLYDEQLVRDADGRGVVVVSKPADRPANAVAACGVTWLDWGGGDTSLILLRNMLPLPEDQFPYAIQYIPGPPGQHEAEVMGPYYPYGNHMMRTAFEALGCPVSPDDFPSVVTPPPVT